jgi:hypothetical protein
MKGRGKVLLKGLRPFGTLVEWEKPQVRNTMPRGRVGGTRQDRIKSDAVGGNRFFKGLRPS